MCGHEEYYSKQFEQENESRRKKQVRDALLADNVKVKCEFCGEKEGLRGIGKNTLVVCDDCLDKYMV